MAQRSGAPSPSSANARKSRWAVTPGVLGALVLAIVLVLAGGLAALRENGETFRAGDRSRRTLQTMVDLARVRDALVEAETGQRGYLLTGNEAYLAPYEQARAETPAALARLRAGIDDPTGAERLGALASLVSTKLDELRRSVDLRHGGDASAALAIVETGAGKDVTDRIRSILAEIEADESREFSARLAARNERRDLALRMIAASTGGAVLAMVVSLALLIRTDRARRRAETEAEAAERRVRSVLSDRLADSESRARAVLDTTASAIISIDARGRIDTFNQAAERLFGYAASEAIGRNVKMLMPAPYRDEHDGYLRRYVETGERKIIGIGREVTGLRKDATTFPMALAVADTMLHGEHIFTAVIHDLTRQKEAEDRERKLLKQALQNERLADVGAMTARVAHDFGNPLAGLRMTAQRMLMLLGRDPLPVDRLRQAADIIVSTTDRLDSLVVEFKDFAREQRLQLSDVELPAFFRDIVAAWRAEAEARDIALQVEVADAPPAVRADPDKLRRVMDNLLKNALEAIDRGPGSIRVAVESHEPERIRILVADTGPGIPTGTDVFALFETTKPTGTGLGLAICKQIVLAHGGDIEHDALPVGTVFRVELLTRGPSAQL